MSAPNMTTSQNRKNKTIHTRKEVITIFEELKNKINIAYQSLTEESFSILLTVIKIMYYLHPLPHFLTQVNQIGSIPVTSFLQNLLIKTNMTKLKIMPTLRNWVITLLLQFKEVIPKLKVTQIKEIKQKKYQLYTEWNQDIILTFINSDFSEAIKRRDVGTISIIVHFLRVYVIYSELNNNFTIEKEDIKWKILITNLVEGSKILDNLKRQQISVCICYYLCLKERLLSHEAIEAGVIHYLILTLNRKHISSYFGKKIIQFLKFLLLQIDSRYHEQISIPVFQHALGLFSFRFDREQIIISIRDLINIFEQKISVIDYQQKLERLSTIYFQIPKQKPIPENFFEALHIINLYIHNERMGNLLVKYYQNLFSKILNEQDNPQVIKMVTGFLSFNFKKGKFQSMVAFDIIRKIYQIITNNLAREELIENRKKFLIDFVKHLQMLLINREHHFQVVKSIHSSQIQAKLWSFSDCTNYMYEKELIQLKRLLGNKNSHQNVNKQVEVLTRLQSEIINKSRFNLNKLSYQLFEQIKFMEILINQNGNLVKTFNPTPQLATVLSNYIQTTNHKSNFALLQNIQNEQNDQLRKQFNLVCTKLLTGILKTNENSKQMQAVKDKIITLTTSKDQIDDVYEVINSFFQIQESIHEQTQKKQQEIKDLQQHQKNSLKNQFLQKIQKLLFQYFKSDENFDISLLKVNNVQDLAIIIGELNNYQNQTDILKYLKIIFELTKKQNICLQIYRMISAKLIAIYQALISRQAGGDKEIVEVLDSIFRLFIKSHIKSLFSDNYDPQSINFYFQIVAEIDNYFQFGFSNKRLELLQLMIEYFQCNVIECHAQYQKLIRKQDRSEIIKSNIDSNKAQSVGLSYGKLLFLNSDDQVHQAFWMMHKQHIIRGLNDNRDNISFLKFIQIYFSQCQRFIYKEYQLQALIEIVIELFNKQCQNMEAIQGYLSQGILKLRKIKYFSNVLQTFIQRQDLKTNKNMLYSEQQALSKAMLLLIEQNYAIRESSNQSFKKFYIEQIIVVLIKTLAKLYKNNFIDKQIRSEYFVQYFDQLMELNNENIIISCCQLMRIFLLKKFFSMAQCTSLRTCQNYMNSLPPLAQEHITACNRIENLLAVDQSLEQQNKLYFLPNPEQEEEQNHQFQKFATDFLRANSDVKQPQIVNIVTSFEPQQQYKKSQEIIQIIESAIQQQIKLEKQKQLQVKSQKLLTPYQLLEAVKKIIEQPTSQSIKELSTKLIDMESLQYCQLLMELFLQSPTIYSHDTSPLQLGLEEVQRSIIKHIPSGLCPVDNKYYEILQRNVIGAQICLKKKGGLKATQVLCEKIIYNQNQDQFCSYLQLLGKNISSNNQLRYINNIKIYEPINSKLQKISKNASNISKTCKFISQTSQFPALRANFQAPSVLTKTLLENSLDMSTKIDVITALTNLTNDCHKHKKISQNTKIVHYITSILKQQPHNQHLYTQSAHLLSNIIDYSQSLIPQIYQLLGLEELIVKILNEQAEKGRYSILIHSCLKILDFLSKNLQSSLKILKTSFHSTLARVYKLSTQNNQNQNIGLQISILANIIKLTETSMAQTLQDLQTAGLIQFFNLASPLVPKVKKSEIFLETLSITVTVPDMIKKFMGNNKEMLNILTQVLKHNQSQMGIIQKWTKLICQLIQNPKFLYTSDILKSNIFYLAANCLKTNTFLTQSTMTMSIRLMKELNAIEDPENLMIRHGFVDYMIQILKMKNLQTQDYIAMLTILKRQQQKTIFPPHLSTKIFEIVIKNLESHWKDQMAISSIILLKKIKKNVEITTQFSHNMYQFFNKFLMQSSKVTSYQYYSISRQVICLISYFVNFNEQVKSMFRNKVIIEILKVWLKAFKNTEEQESAQTFRLWMYSVYNDQAFHYDICTINQTKMQQIQKRFEKGWKCNLFRMDGSYKNALFKYSKNYQEVQAFKYPDGQVKPKYRLPLKNILVIYRYKNLQQLLFSQSRFKRTINPFQHQVNPLNCLTLFCLIEERYQVREISLEIENRLELQEVYSFLKILLNKLVEQQREQEIKLWAIRSSKQFRLVN